MKVLQVNAVYYQGSTGRNLFEMHNYFSEHGVDSIIAATHLESKEKNIYQIGNCFDWKMHALLSRITGLQGYYSNFATNKLIGLIIEQRPDIVHLNNLHANYINLNILFSYLSKNNIATVITLHDCWFFTGKCSHYTVAGCNKWQIGCGKCQKLKDDNASWFLDRTNKMLEDKRRWYTSLKFLAVIGVSDWITQEAKKSVLKDALITKRIYNWIDLDVFSPDSRNESLINKFRGKKILLGVASIWNDNKGLDLFCKLSKILQPNEVLVLIGNLKDKEIPQNIIHVNTVQDANDLSCFYSAADVFLQLSVEESFGKVVAESLACGTPVITIDSTANSELVDPSCGIVIPDRDIMHIRAAINEIISSGKNFYKDNCRTFAVKNFNMYDRISDYLKVYQELIDKRKN